jgi:hypothetical protein
VPHPVEHPAESQPQQQQQHQQQHQQHQQHQQQQPPAAPPPRPPGPQPPPPGPKRGRGRPPKTAGEYTESYRAVKEYRNRSKQRMSALEQELTEKLGQLQLLTAENQALQVGGRGGRCMCICACLCACVCVGGELHSCVCVCVCGCVGVWVYEGVCGYMCKHVFGLFMAFFRGQGILCVYSGV